MLADLMNGTQRSPESWFLIRATTGEYYTGLLTTPHKNRSKALHFTSASWARDELSHMRASGHWPLYDWKVVRVPKR